MSPAAKSEEKRRLPAAEKAQDNPLWKQSSVYYEGLNGVVAFTVIG